MPIHDQGYRRYAGRRRPAGTAWWVIARQQMRTVLSQKRYIALLLLAWIPFVARVVQIYLAANFQQAAFLATSAQLFRSFLDQQGLFVFLLIVGASGAIADDRRANALQVYLSKPLTRVEYIVGKLFAPLVFVLGITLLPALLLLVVHVAFSGSLTFVVQNLYLLPAIVLYSLSVALVGTFTMVALSSLSKSRRFTALTFTGLFFFTAAMYQALQRITGSRLWALISPRDILSVIGDAAFRIPGQRALPVWAALLGVIVIIGLSVLVLERRIRGVEVVQ
jgi:ABC-2 type transport system permease protein